MTIGSTEGALITCGSIAVIQGRFDSDNESVLVPNTGRPASAWTSRPSWSPTRTMTASAT